MEFAWELILVDDASRDSTAALLTDLANEHERVRAVFLDSHQGKGAAVLAGIRCARGTLFLFADDDMEFDLSVLPRLLKGVGDGADLVNGRRSGRDRGSLVRRLASALLLKIFQPCNPCHLADPTSPIKCTERALFEGIDDAPWFRSFPHEFAVSAARRGVEIPVQVWSRQATPSRFSTGALVREYVGLVYAVLQCARQRTSGGVAPCE